jgi:AbrB family looped-hinge helix DNA binding protein
MTYQTTITSKGQLMLPKKIREILGLQTGERVLLEPDKNRKSIKIGHAPKIASLAGSFIVKKAKDPLAIRKSMEKNYSGQ